MGKVEFLNLYPLNFSEFLIAMGQYNQARLLEDGDFANVTAFGQTYTHLLKHYFAVGGMPEAVQAFARNQDFAETREIQRRILDAYGQDFSKRASSDIAPRIRILWNSIPSQLAKENKKFNYGLVRGGTRAQEYEHAMLWLTDCRLVHQVHRLTVPSLPLKAYEDLQSFKLFLLDVGLLSCMVQGCQKTHVADNDLFEEFKGELTHQYVLQQLKTVPELDAYYWSNGPIGAEIDFVIDTGVGAIPIEVDAEINVTAKNLRAYHDKFDPPVSIRTAMTDYMRQEGILNIPLYAICRIRHILDREGYIND